MMFCTNAQKMPIISNNDMIMMSSQFIVGVSNGIRSEALYHPDKLISMHPNWNKQWWDSRISWTNKNGHSFMYTPFSDANHFFQATSTVFSCISIGITATDVNDFKYMRSTGRKILFVAFKIVKAYVAEKAGFFVSYNLYCKNNL